MSHDFASFFCLKTIGINLSVANIKSLIDVCKSLSNN